MSSQRPEAREFQRAAVDLITARLSDPAGTGRFLLADEVGLGKTVVTRHVMDALKPKRSGLLTVYVCSNREIAEQNKTKLTDEAEERIDADRLGLLATRTSALATQRRSASRLIAITPRTSLELGRSAGTTEERQLVYYLLRKLFPDLRRAKWLRAFLKRGAGDVRWRALTAPRALGHAYDRKVSVDLLRRLKRAWTAPQSEVGSDGVHPSPVELLRDEGRREASPGRVIGMLRSTLARAVLEVLRPDLVVLDEFQRFSEVLHRASIASSLEYALLAGAGPTNRRRILLLSATPHRVYAGAAVEGEPDKELEALLRFLFKDRPREVEAIATALHAMREEFRKGDFLRGADQALRRAKATAEAGLQKVMCRTERSWFFEDDARKGIHTEEGSCDPTPAALEDAFRLVYLAAKTGQSVAQAIDWWRSGPRPLAFMDASYSVFRAAKKKKGGLDAKLALSRGRPSDLVAEHPRMAELAKVVLGDPGPGRRSFRHLWVAPSYRYYADEGLFTAEPPSKHLVFSHWRFVPRMVSAVLSDAMQDRVGKVPNGSPLKLGRGLAHFTVCYPSEVLATEISPARIAASLERGGEVPRANALVRVAKRQIWSLLQQRLGSGLAKGTRETASLWEVLARLENEAWADSLSVAARAQDLRSARGDLRRFLTLRRGERLVISDRTLTRLAEMALFSPAVCVLRACVQAFPAPKRSQTEATRFARATLRVGFDAIRRYFNWDFVQAIVRREGGRGEYQDRVLTYCRRGHVAAVLEEFAALLKNPPQCRDATAALEHLGRVLDLRGGRVRVNKIRNGTLHDTRDARQVPTHFAVAFGEETSSESSGGAQHQMSAVHRRTRLREAFNSPFWPFVLATTSVGQEGLDFHLYCRNVVHWNLPSNPIDLEQREGRVNRYGGLWVRRAIADAHPRLSVLLGDGDTNAAGTDAPTGAGAVWPRAFAHAEQAEPHQSYKRGLFPFWVYEPAKAGGSQPSVQRQFVTFAMSEDEPRRKRLLEEVRLYRLAFGQPEQRELVSSLERALAECADRKAIERKLPAYMINLSPFRAGYAARRAAQWAKEHQEDWEALEELTRGAELMLPQVAELGDAGRRDAALLIEHVREHAKTHRAPRIGAVAALEYLRDPFDDTHDSFGSAGLEDDVEELRRAARELRRGKPRKLAPSGR